MRRSVEAYQEAMKKASASRVPQGVDLARVFSSPQLSQTLSQYNAAMSMLANAKGSRELQKALERVAEVENAFAVAMPATAYIAAPANPSFLSVGTVTTVPGPRPADSTRAEPNIDLLRRLAPPDWGKNERRRLTKALGKNRPVNLIVLQADIRNSTYLMQEAIDPYGFASTLEEFTTRSQKTVWDNGGLFDKFTGDGILAYWSFASAKGKPAALRKVFRSVRKLHSDFVQLDIPRFRANSYNFITSVGLGIGLDEGPANFVAMGGAATVVGRPVIGARRMVDAADSKESLANAPLGEYLLEATSNGEIRDVDVTRVERAVKSNTQSAYAIFFPDLVLEEA